MSESNLPKDEYLSDEEVVALKRQLDEQLELIVSKSNEAVTKLTDSREAEADLLDLASTESNRDFTLRLQDRDRRLLSKLKKALLRIQQGEYGVCESCGAPITYKRLMARPVATFCIDCKTEMEQMERRPGF